MRILFSPVADADAAAALQLCCQTVQPELVILYRIAGAAPAEQLQTALSGFGEVRVTERPAVSAATSSDELLADFSSLLTELRRANPDAEIYLDTIAGTDAMQEVMIDLITATNLELLPAISAAPVQQDAPAAAPEQPAEASAPAEPAENPAELAAEGETPDAVPAEPAAPAVDVDALLAEQTAKVTAALTAKQLCTLIDAYDYTGALTLARSADAAVPPQFAELLEAVILRSSGRFMEAQQKFRACGQTALMPNAAMNSEYFLLLGLYLKRKDYTGFLRAAPPYLIELLIAAIRTKFQMDITQYMSFGSRKWDHSKLMLGQMTGKFKESYTYHQKPKPGNLGVYVTTANLSNLLENLVVPRRDAQLMLDTLKLRLDIEEKTRGLASFTLRGVTAQEIHAASTHTPEELLQMILNYARNYTDISLTDEYLRSYESAGAVLKAMLA